MKRVLAYSLVLLATAIAAAEDRSTDRRSLVRGGVVRGDPTTKQIALIFTGGEYAEGVPTILRVCRERGIPAAFFVTGDFLRLHANAARAIIAEGLPLGPHGDGHLLYCDWNDRDRTLVTREQFDRDLAKNLADLAGIGAPPTRFFVPPFEWYNADQVAWAKARGLTLINFTPGSGSNRDYIPEGDPKFASSADLVRGILDFERREPRGLNGFLMLLHTGSKRIDKMHDRFDELVAGLQTQGYTFVSLETLLPSTAPTSQSENDVVERDTPLRK